MIREFLTKIKINKIAKNLEAKFTYGEDNRLSKIIKDLTRENEEIVGLDFFRDLAALREGFFINDNNSDRKDYVLSVYLIEKALNGEKCIFFFDNEDRKKRISLIINMFKNINDIEFELNEKEISKKEFYMQDIILVEINTFGSDLLNTFHSKNIEDIILSEEIFNRTAIIDDLKIITIFGEYRHFIADVKDEDIEIIKEAVILINDIISNQDYWEMNKNEYILTDLGVGFLEEKKLIDNIFTNRKNYLLMFYIEKLLYIKHTYEKDVDYEVIGREIFVINKNILNIEKRLLQGIENITIEDELIEKEGLSNFILIYHFFNIIGISYAEKKYLNFLSDVFKIKSICFHKEDTSCLKKKVVDKIHNHVDIFKYGNELKSIHLDNSFNYGEIKYIQTVLSDKNIVLVNYDIGKGKLQLKNKIEEQKMLISYQLLIWRKMFVYHKIKEKIVSIGNIIGIVDFFLKNADTDFSPECILNYNKEASFSIVSKELFIVINSGREKMYEEIRTVVDNLYFTTLNKKDPLLLIEKKLFLLLEDTLNEVYYNSLIKLKNKKLNNQKINIEVISY